MYKYLLFTILIFNLIWFDLYNAQITGIDFVRNLLSSLALTFPIMTFKSQRISYSWFLIVFSYIGWKWASQLESLASALVYELTLIFVILLCFQKWGQKIGKVFQNSLHSKLLRYFWIFLFVDLLSPIPIKNSLLVYHNPLRDLRIAMFSTRNPSLQKRKINLELSSSKKDSFIFIEIPYFTADLFEIIKMQTKELKPPWKVKRQFLLPSESLKRSSFFIKHKKNVNYTVGKVNFLKKEGLINSSRVSPEEQSNFNTKTKFSSMYSLLRDNSLSIQRLYGNLSETHLELTEALPPQIKGLYDLRLLSLFLKKINNDLKDRKFYIFILGSNRSKLKAPQTSKYSLVLQPFYLLTNDSGDTWKDLFPKDFDNRVEVDFWDQDIEIIRDKEKIILRSKSGLLRKAEHTITF